MKVVVAMDSYKGCMTAIEACQAVSCGINATFPQSEQVLLPMSDGGDGMLDAFVTATSCDIEPIEVSGPIPGTKVTAKIGYINNGKTAIIESAQACGLSLIDEGKRNPTITTSYGVGEMITHAVDKGCKKIIIGLGGSGTNDFGIGILGALGITFLDSSNSKLEPIVGNIDKISHIAGINKVSELFSTIQVLIASDVVTPLYGPLGATYTFGPQKGATALQVKELEIAAHTFSNIVSQEIGADLSDYPGAGAAGGIGYALKSFIDCTFMSGAELMMRLTDFENQIKDANLIITGEGKSDKQTLLGKIPGKIVECATRHNVNCALLSGTIDDEELLRNSGFSEIIPVTKPGTPLDIAMRKDIAAANISNAVKAITQISL